MEILSFESLPSTQQYLVEQIRSKKIVEPVALIAGEQTDGIGSRGNSWEGGDGNFFVSIAFDMDSLPDDLPLQAASIYFGYIMKESLAEAGANVWIKWPNDLYREGSKVGGIITQKIKSFLVVGIGVNLKKNENGYSSLSSDISPLILLNIFLSQVEKYPKWKQILSKFRVEFEEHRAYDFHYKGTLMSLEGAQLCDDGSLVINNERIYNQR